jgi:uncharacterized protein (UPF0254 family)
MSKCDGTCNIYLSDLAILTRAVKKLLDTLPPDPDAYYDHWDAGSEETDGAAAEIRKLINYPKVRDV